MSTRSSGPGARLSDAVLLNAVRRRMADVAIPGRFASGATVVRQGEAVEALVLLTAGRALGLRAVDGEDVPVEDLGPGDLVGLDGAFGAGIHSVTLRAVTALEVDLIPAPAFRAVVERDPEAGLLAFSLLAGRLRRCIQATEDHKLRDATARTVSYLAELAGDAGQGGVEVTLPVAKKTLARHLGVTQQSLSRVLHQLRAEGVTVRGPRVHIQDMSVLRAIGCMGDEP